MSQAFIWTSLKLSVGLKTSPKMNPTREESCFASHNSPLHTAVLLKTLPWQNRSTRLLRETLINLQASCRCVSVRAKTDTPFWRQRISGKLWGYSTRKRNASTCNVNAWPAARSLTGWATCECMLRRIYRFARSHATCARLSSRLLRIVIDTQATKCAQKDRTRIETSENFCAKQKLWFEKDLKTKTICICLIEDLNFIGFTRYEKLA